MSKIQVNEVVNHFDNGAPDFPRGVTVTGISTVNGNIDVNLTNVTVSGILTATSFSGDGSALTGTGVGTETSINTTGIITATSFSGDGSALTGIAGTANVSTNTLNVIGVSTFTGAINSNSNVTTTADLDSRYLYVKDIFMGDVSPELRFTDSDHNPDYRIRLNSGLLGIRDITNNIDKMVFNTDGVKITGITSVTGSIAVNGNNYPTAGALSNRNLIVNGSMLIAQKGTSSQGTTGIDTVDRFKVASNVGVSRYQKTLSSSDDPYNEGLRKYLQIMNAPSTTIASYREIDYKIEAQDLSQSGWLYTSSSSYITLSFWVRASVSQTYYVYLRTDDSTDRVYTFPFTLVANTWKKVVQTIPGDSNITINTDNGIGMLIRWIPWYGAEYTGSGATNETWRNSSGAYVQDMTNTWAATTESTFDLTGIQLEVGEKNTPFETRPISEELLRCQRYFIRQDWVLCNALTGIAYRWVPPGPSVNMRATPAMAYFNPSTGTANQTYEHSSATVRTINSSPAALSATSGTTAYFGTSTNGTYGQYVRVHMDAEL